MLLLLYHLIKRISSVLQKLLESFNVISVSTSFLSLVASVLLVIFGLRLNKELLLAA